MEYGYLFHNLFSLRYAYRYFLGFFSKTSSSLFVCYRAQKFMRMQPSIIFLSFRTRLGNMKNDTHGVSFNLFSHSIKTKRLSSDLVLFTLIKVFE
jgi:hypothetical protein